MKDRCIIRGFIAPNNKESFLTATYFEILL